MYLKAFALTLLIEYLIKRFKNNLHLQLQNFFNTSPKMKLKIECNIIRIRFII